MSFVDQLLAVEEAAADAATKYTDPTQAIEAAGAVRLGAFAYRNRTAVWSDPNGWQVRALSKDGKTVLGFKHTTATTSDLGTSTDDGATYTVRHSFAQLGEAILTLDTGELLVVTRIDSQRSEIWATAGWVTDPATATWTRVRQAPTSTLGTYPSGRYGGLTQDGKGNVWAADYGKKTNEFGAGLGPAQTAVRVIHSADRGQTYREIFRLDQWLTARGIDPAAAGYHLHGCAYDPYLPGRLWVTFGDYYNVTTGECGLIYSDNPTATTPVWNVLYLGSQQVGGNFQAVNVIPMRSALVLQADGNPAAIYRVPRLPGGTFGPVGVGYLATNATGSPIAGGATWQAPYPGAPLLLPISQSVTTAGSLSRLVATADGLRFHELHLDTAQTTITAFGGLWSVVGPTASGKIVATSTADGRYAVNRSTLTIDAATL